MSTIRLFVCLLFCVACGHRASPAPSAPNAAPPDPGPPLCRGDAPLDQETQQVPGARASWFTEAGTNQRLYVFEAGAPTAKLPPLLLVHGIGNKGIGDFYPVLAQLARSRRVLAVDMPGFGRSDKQGEEFGPDRLVDALIAVVRACTPGKVDVLGHSSGAAVALLYAARHAELTRRLVLVDVAGLLRPEALLPGQLHQRLKPLAQRRPVASRIVEGVGKGVVEFMAAIVPSAEDVADTGLIGKSPAVLAATALLDYNFGPAMLRVRVPSLVLWGEQDDVVPPRIAHMLDDRLPDSDVIFLPGAGHVPMKDQPELLVARISDYLAGPAPLKREALPPNTATREGTCKGTENVVITGDYARIVIRDCKNVWINEARARQVVIEDSEARLDKSTVSEGLTVKDSELSITGGSIAGTVALSVSDSKLDVAGTELVGSQLAVQVEEASEAIFSVTPIRSPRGDRVLHDDLDLAKGQEY